MIRVDLRENETAESLIHRFNAAVMADGILKEVKEKSRYEKPSAKKRRLRKQKESEKMTGPR